MSDPISRIEYSDKYQDDKFEFRYVYAWMVVVMQCRRRQLARQRVEVAAPMSLH